MIDSMERSIDCLKKAKASLASFEAETGLTYLPSYGEGSYADILLNRIYPESGKNDHGEYIIRCALRRLFAEQSCSHYETLVQTVKDCGISVALNSGCQRSTFTQKQ